MKKSLWSPVIASLLISSIVSCGAGQTTVDSVTALPAPPTEENTTAAETEPVYVIEPQDFGGIDFTIFGVEPHHEDWIVNTYSEADAEEENGDLINDAIYRRNLEVEEAYNIQIHAKGTTRGQVGSEALKVILSGENIYDAIHLHGASMHTVIGRPDTLYNLFDIHSIDLSAPWWDHNSEEALRIGDTLMCVVGDMNIRTFFASSILTFNQQMIKDFHLENPFDLVKSGDWDIETMMEMCKTVTIDQNGDGVISIEDTAGFFGEPASVYYGLNACGEQIVQNNESHLPEITLNNERVIKAIELYVEILRNADYGIYSSDISRLFSGENIWRTRMLPMLEENKLLFYNGNISDVLDLRNMKADFGLIPMPKLDKTQERYYTSSHPQYLSFCSIPITNPEPERTGLILNTLNALSSQYVVPAVYESTLTDKVLRDNTSIEMLELISHTRIYDIGFIYNFGSAQDFILSFAERNSKDFASLFAKRESKMQKAIDKFVKNFTEEP